MNVAGGGGGGHNKSVEKRRAVGMGAVPCFFVLEVYGEKERRERRERSTVKPRNEV
jgi:hypothetical protein